MGSVVNLMVRFTDPPFLYPGSLSGEDEVEIQQIPGDRAPRAGFAQKESSERNHASVLRALTTHWTYGRLIAY